jgi:hypothetical protein
MENMQERIFKFIFGAGALLSALAVPGYSSNSAFTFTTSTAGTVDLNSSGDVICVGTGTSCPGGSAAVTFGDFISATSGEVVFNATLSENLNSGVITLVSNSNLSTGIFASNPITSGETLVTIDLLTATSTLATAIGSPVDIQWANSDLGSITVASGLLADLGDSGFAASFNSPANSALQGPTAAASGDNTLNSNTLTINLTATPEPMSFVLFGSGLLGVGLLARRRSSQRAR